MRRYSLSSSNGHNCAERQLQKPLFLSGSQRKTAHALRLNVERQIEEDGLNQTGFLTLTVGDYDEAGRFHQVKNAGDASKRIHVLLRRFLPSVFSRGVIVSERHASGAIHFHLVVTMASGADIRSGLNFDAIARRDYRSASAELRSTWEKLRAELPKFGFGRAELLPIKKTSREIGSYVSRYIEKNISSRIEEDKGKKLVRYFGWEKKQLKANDFSWATPKACRWRIAARKLAALVGVESRAEAHECFGPRWAYRLSRVMQAVEVGSGEGVTKELSVFDVMAAARQLVFDAASRQWVRARQRMNDLRSKGAQWAKTWRSLTERRQETFLNPAPC